VFRQLRSVNLLRKGRCDFAAIDSTQRIFTFSMPAGPACSTQVRDEREH
jgi:hypothetical protein